MKTTTLALNHLSLNGEQLVVDPGSFSPYFNEELYSRFKHGDGIATEHFGNQLADLLADRRAISACEPMFVSGSAYQFVPTAAAHLAISLTNTLRSRGYNATHFQTHNRAVTTKSDVPTGDFSGMSAADRRLVMAANRPHLDAATREMVNAGTVITVDDIRMTGAHEDTLVELFSGVKVGHALLCYLAMFDPLQGAANARIEREINQRHVPDLTRLAEIACGASFLPNARISRFVLQAAAVDVDVFGKSIPSASLATLVSHMRAEGYDTNPKYLHKLSLLEDTLKNERNI